MGTVEGLGAGIGLGLLGGFAGAVTLPIGAGIAAGGATAGYFGSRYLCPTLRVIELGTEDADLDEEGNYGFFVRRRSFVLAKGTGPGIVLQKITRQFDVTDDQANTLTAANIDWYAGLNGGTADAAVRSYYEAWYIAPGATKPTYEGLAAGEGPGDDCLSLSSIGNDHNPTTGEFIITAEAWYYPLFSETRINAAQVCAEYGLIPKHDSSAGILPYSPGLPRWLAVRPVHSPTYRRRFTSEWNAAERDDGTGAFNFAPTHVS